MKITLFINNNIKLTNTLKIPVNYYQDKTHMNIKTLKENLLEIIAINQKKNFLD